MMKKTILLGVLSFFAINVITIQTATAQAEKPKKTVSSHPREAVSSHSNPNLEKARGILSTMTKEERKVKWEKLSKVSPELRTTLDQCMLDLLNEEFGVYRPALGNGRVKAKQDNALEAQVEQQLAQMSPVERQNLWRSLTNKSNKRNVSLTDKERIMLRLLNKEFKK